MLNILPVFHSGKIIRFQARQNASPGSGRAFVYCMACIILLIIFHIFPFLCNAQSLPEITFPHHKNVPFAINQELTGTMVNRVELNDKRVDFPGSISNSGIAGYKEKDDQNVSLVSYIQDELLPAPLRHVPESDFIEVEQTSREAFILQLPNMLPTGAVFVLYEDSDGEWRLAYTTGNGEKVNVALSELMSLRRAVWDSNIDFFLNGGIDFVRSIEPASITTRQMFFGLPEKFIGHEDHEQPEDSDSPKETDEKNWGTKPGGAVKTNSGKLDSSASGEGVTEKREHLNVPDSDSTTRVNSTRPEPCGEPSQKEATRPPKEEIARLIQRVLQARDIAKFKESCVPPGARNTHDFTNA